MKVAMYAGSFDPITNGHLDIIYRAIKLFDKIYVCIANNPNKKCLFSPEERVNLIKETVKDFPEIEVVYTNDLTIKKAEELGVNTIIRGLRAVTDFEFEFQLASGYRFIDKDIEMVFLMSSSELCFISSSAVKEFAEKNVDVSSLVPSCVNEALIKKYNK